MMGRLAGPPGRGGRAGAGRELLERFDLVDAGAGAGSATYSGGMRRRLDLARQPGRAPGGALPRRADDRPRPAQPAGDVGGDRRARRRRRDGLPHHPVPRGGRPPGRPHRRHRRRPRRRRGHRGRAQAARRRAAAGPDAGRRGAPTRPPRPCSASAAIAPRPGAPDARRPHRRQRRRTSRGAARRGRSRRAPRSPRFASTAPRSTTSSSPSPVTRPAGTEPMTEKEIARV